MPGLSSLYQFFNPDTCHASIHMLRWKNHPLQCPRCHSHHVGPWGTDHYRPGVKRYWCKDCRRTFNDLTHTLLAQSKRSFPHWILATFLLCLSCSSCRIARELGVHPRTSYRWCWWLRHAALSYETERQLEGTVEADDLYHTAGNKGQAKQGRKKSLARRARGRRKKREPGRGHDDKDRPAMIAWVSRQGSVVIQATKDFTVKTVQKAADLAVQAGSRLSTDSARSYRAVKGYVHEYVNHTQKEYARGEVHEHRAECLFSLLKPYLRVFRGLRGYPEIYLLYAPPTIPLVCCHINDFPRASRLARPSQGGEKMTVVWGSHHEELCSASVVAPYVRAHMVAPHCWGVLDGGTPLGAAVDASRRPSMGRPLPH